MTETAPLIEARNLKASYGDIRALFGIDFRLFAGEAVAIIGANGAGKTTFLRCLTGVVQALDSEILFEGQRINGVPSHQIVRRGIAMVPEGRCLFPSLTVEENLLVGRSARRSGTWTLERVYELFPDIQERRYHHAMALSGGQQQMVAIGRALLANPRVLLCDEISMGLAPIIIRSFYAKLPQIRADGIALVIVEQDINQALAVADRLYCFQEGRVSLTGPADQVDRDRIVAAYLGV